MPIFLSIAIAIFLDRLLGEPKSYNPLKGFAKIAIFVENLCHVSKDNLAQSDPQTNQSLDNLLKIKGSLAVLFLVLPFFTLAVFLSNTAQPINFIFQFLILYLTIGAHSLKQHALEVQNSLAQEDIEAARIKIDFMVHRDTKTMTKNEILSSCIEYILVKGDDAVLASIFWFVIFGAPGALLFRLINILDAMWGHKSARYQNFGLAAAKLDYLLNWLPARLTAFSYILMANLKSGWQCLNEQLKNLYCPNAWLTMAAGAGALKLEIGGNVLYEGQLIQRPKIGLGKPPELPDISRALDLIDRSMILWLTIILILNLSHCL